MLRHVYFTRDSPAIFGIELDTADDRFGSTIGTMVDSNMADTSLFFARPGVVKIGNVTISTSERGIEVSDQRAGAAYLNEYLAIRAPRAPGGSVSPQTRFWPKPTFQFEVHLRWLGCWALPPLVWLYSSTLDPKDVKCTSTSTQRVRSTLHRLSATGRWQMRTTKSSKAVSRWTNANRATPVHFLCLK